MPAKKKTKQDRLVEAFTAFYKIGKARAGLRDSDVANVLGLTQVTLRKRRNNPKEFRAGELATLAVLFRWETVEVNNLIELMQ